MNKIVFLYDLIFGIFVSVSILFILEKEKNFKLFNLKMA